MQLKYLLGTGAALATLSLGSAAFAQASVAIDPYQPPPPNVQPAPPYMGQPGQPAQPGQPVYVYPPGTQPPVYYQPQPQPPPRIVGYSTRPRVGLIIGGAVVLGSVWLINVAAGAISQASCDTFSSSCGTYWPLYIPVLGPFIQMGYVPNDSSKPLAMFGLAFDGIVQTGGLIMLILGATLRQRVPVYAKNWQISPTFNSGGSGLAYSLRF